MFLNRFEARTIFGQVEIIADSRYTEVTRMIQTLVLANSVHRPHSQISMRMLSLSLFYKIVKIRACGRQRPPIVVFWLRLVSLLGFKNSYEGISLKNSFTTVCRCKKKKSFCCLPTQIREIWFGRPLKIESNSTDVDFAAQSAAQQCNWLYKEHAKRLRTQLNVLV